MVRSRACANGRQSGGGFFQSAGIAYPAVNPGRKTQSCAVHREIRIRPNVHQTVRNGDGLIGQTRSQRLVHDMMCVPRGLAK